MATRNFRINFTLQTFLNPFMHLHDLSQTNSILNVFVTEMRDVSIQKDRMRFRRNIERIGEVLGYEMSKSFS